MLLPLLQAAKAPAKQAMAGAAVVAVQERLPLKLRKAPAALLPKGYQGDEGNLMGCKSLLLHLTPPVMSAEQTSRWLTGPCIHMVLASRWVQC